MVGQRAYVNVENQTMTFVAVDGKRYTIDLVQTNTGHVMIPIKPANPDSGSGVRSLWGEVGRTIKDKPPEPTPPQWTMQEGCLTRHHTQPRHNLYNPDEDKHNHGLPREVFTGGRVTEKHNLEETRPEVIHDDWLQASHPEKIKPKLWRGSTTLAVVPEYQKNIMDAVDIDNDEDPQHQPCEPKEPKTVVVLHRLAEEAQESLRILENIKGLTVHFADLARHPEEQRAKQITEQLPEGSRLIIALPGCPVKTGTSKDRRRTSRAVLLARQAARKGTQVIITAPSRTPTTQHEELQLLAAETGWSKLEMPMCAIMTGRAGPHAKQPYNIYLNGRFAAPVCSTVEFSKKQVSEQQTTYYQSLPTTCTIRLGSERWQTQIA
eukprot:1928904-Amphidinium_carterae.3